ncbi:MAG: ComEC/Rec2 family competence protein [Candidatus Peribacteraceae bacterium]
MTRYRILFAVLLVCLLVSREWLLLDDGRLHIRFLSIGQGDATLLTLPSGADVLIDGGMDWATLEKLPKYMSFFDRSIELVILSHDNADHLMALPEIAKRYRVDMFLTSGYGGSARYKAILERLRSQGSTILVMNAGDQLTLDDGVTLDVLWPPTKIKASVARGFNNVSLVAALEYQGKRILFTGDIEKVAEETLIRTNTNLRADILKVAHHGSKTSSIDGFLRRVNPTLAVISAGRDNSHGHPHEEVVERYQKHGIEVRRTDEEGDIEIIW